MNKVLKNQIENSFALAVMDFKDKQELLNFFKDFLSEKEFEILSKRLSVVYWLSKKRSYENIKNNLKVSSATIAESKNLLEKDSIKKGIKKIDADIWADKWSQKIKSLIKGS